MKKATIILLLFSSVTFCFSQVKQDTSKKPAAHAQAEKAKVKPQFQINQSKIYTITFQGTYDELTTLVTSPDEWKQIEQSPQLSGQQITQIKDATVETRKRFKEAISIPIRIDIKHFNDSIKVRDRLEADSIKKAKH